MEIQKSVFEDMKAMAAQFHSLKNAELEAKMQGRITREMFARVVHYLRTHGYSEFVHPETLDILFTLEQRPCRLSVRGMEAIQKYCVSNALESEDVHEALSKTFVQGFKPVIIEDINFKLDIRQERKLTDVEKVGATSAVSTALKGFRMKKRYSYTTLDGVFRVDCTVVKRSKSGGVDGRQFQAHTRLLDGELGYETYEIEVELLKRASGAGAKAAAPVRWQEDTCKAMLQRMAELYMLAQGQEAMVSKDLHAFVLGGYIQLWRRGKMPYLDEIKRSPRKFFLGPQPVTLEQKNVVTDGLTNTILEDYTVTEKADGERCLLYVDKGGVGYFLNSKLDVIPTGVTFPNIKSTILDGEYITQDAGGNPMRMFALFDVYYYNGTNVMSLPLMSESGGSRLALLEDFMSKYKARLAASRFTFTVKQFLHGEGADIFKQAKLILDQAMIGTFPYRIDGLIFTPKSLAVGGEFKGDQGDQQGTWNRLFKWKPPQENTIDFQVKEVRDDYGGVKRTVHDGKVMTPYHLYVGYKPAQWEPIKARAYIEGRVVKNNTYITKLFTPPEEVAPVYDFYGEGVCKNGDEITYNSIVEFAYLNDPSIDPPLRWVPLRVRKDKTAPNDFGPATNVWRSIHYPVNEEVIKGMKALKKAQLAEEQVYYKRTMKRDKFASNNMMVFHNYWVKNKTIMQGVLSYVYHVETLLDLACGKGGDIRKWQEAGITNVLGLDSVRDNIENPVDGAYARLMDMGLSKNLNYLFLTMDASKRIKLDQVTDKDDQEVAKSFWGVRTSLHAPPSYRMGHCMVSQFEAVTCMFALHYFYKSKETLDAFANNVISNLKPGGVFVGVCLDGKKVKAALKGKRSIAGKSETDGRILWNIEKLYANEDAIQCGDMIRVYMESIGQEVEEPLVDLALLEERLANHDIRLEDVRSFEEVYNISLTISDTNEYYDKALRGMSAVEKEYSFMNMFFVFKSYSKARDYHAVPPPKEYEVTSPSSPYNPVSPTDEWATNVDIPSVYSPPYPNIDELDTPKYTPASPKYEAASPVNAKKKVVKKKK